VTPRPDQWGDSGRACRPLSLLPRTVRRVLEELRLRGLGVIEDAVLELGPGFTAITGETGAGKTMLLTGLALLLGGRADAGAVRRGHDRADVDGRIRIDPDGPVAHRAAEAGADLDDDVLVIARTVATRPERATHTATQTADHGDATAGRSRAFLGGRPVPVSVLGEIAEDLVAVHGQADQRGLLRPAVQRAVLDRYAGATAATALAAYSARFRELAAVRAELAEVTGRRRERMQEADLLRLGLTEVGAVAPLAGEDRELKALVERLAHVDQLTRAATTAHSALAGAEDATAVDALGLLGSARRALDEARGRDAALDELAGRLSEATYLVADVAADLATYAAATEADPGRLEQAHHRLADLTGLTRKYAADVDGVIAWAEHAASRLAELDGDDGRVEELTTRHGQLVAELTAAAAQLSAVRSAAARRLEEAVGRELADLAMPQAQLVVSVEQRADEHGIDVGGQRVAFAAHGVDDVALLLVAHAGADPRPLHRGASGGELSRLMLAVEVVLAGTDPVPTFVFDEVDAGVGGAAAVEVGRRLAMLARTAQVLVVTHLPQVAAFADAHLVVRRSEAADSASVTRVVKVDGEQRLQELSRMLGGMADSELGRGHAQELLTAAASSKAGAARR
jgi:DNA repair protein RecN (Recombination protein N)